MTAPGKPSDSSDGGRQPNWRILFTAHQEEVVTDLALSPSLLAKVGAVDVDGGDALRWKFAGNLGPARFTATNAHLDGLLMPVRTDSNGGDGDEVEAGFGDDAPTEPTPDNRVVDLNDVIGPVAQAKQLIAKDRLVSVTTAMLMRKLTIGHRRAERVIDQLVADGVVGPPTGERNECLVLNP